MDVLRAKEIHDQLKKYVRKWRKELEVAHPVRGEIVLFYFFFQKIHKVADWTSSEKRMLIQYMKYYPSENNLEIHTGYEPVFVRNIGNKNNVTHKDLVEYAHSFTMKSWGIMFSSRIELVNNYWRKYLGYFTSKTNYQTGERDLDYCHIRMSKLTMRRMTKEEIYATLEHELVHWYLYVIGKDNADTSPDFVREIKRLNVKPSGARNAREAYNRYN